VASNQDTHNQNKNTRNDSTSLDNQSNPRRDTLRKLLAGGTVATVIPLTWTSPRVESVLLPAHAQTTGPQGPGCSTFEQTFNAGDEWEVPAGVSQVEITLAGGGGGGGGGGAAASRGISNSNTQTGTGGSGGDGAVGQVIVQTVSVVPGETLLFVVGQGGAGGQGGDITLPIATADGGTGGTGDPAGADGSSPTGAILGVGFDGLTSGAGGGAGGTTSITGSVFGTLSAQGGTGGGGGGSGIAILGNIISASDQTGDNGMDGSTGGGGGSCDGACLDTGGSGGAGFDGAGAGGLDLRTRIIGSSTSGTGGETGEPRHGCFANRRIRGQFGGFEAATITGISDGPRPQASRTEVILDYPREALAFFAPDEAEHVD
jgi:hypothetical protein